MSIKDVSAPQQLRLFRSDWLERFTVITPAGFLATWFCILALVLWLSWGRASVPASVALALLGLVLWSLYEYAMHRFLFHMRMRTNAGRWLLFVMHGNHHVNPNDRHRNLMPPVASMMLCGSVWLALLLIAGSLGSVIFLGFGLGYVIYDSVHYACHQLPVRGRLMKQLRRHHIRHHHTGHDGNYAITAIFWDRLFGTRIPLKAS